MNKLTVETLVESFGGVSKAAERFNVTRTAVLKWRTRGVPEYVALLCHLSPCVDYTFRPQDYGREQFPLLLDKDHQPTLKMEEAN
ncbi:hypothetical protein [Plesiomonas shigelloides]|uniref:Helix-turn-helix domain-containing protein n=1 Tax=Plesiomonas shigelloides TaxID=703 RepID=A0A8E0W5E1_PLESH|nr:hypothetical protein [Plesiomonas shigelloides]KAB7687399.1 hypothetical protein GBN28_11980 [Plesiomonas shigelloides]MBO1107728.1 hypothetical protein [Plesiomonas shigelloides]QIY07457.1 hypothetical protein FOC33_01505 [Plesiomonas shigelloides]QOH78489.1 hypothetical protein IHE26_08400 [Plesiomonas shigelloides]